MNRSILELLKLLLDFYQIEGADALCITVDLMLAEDVISGIEHELLNEYLANNRPEPSYSHSYWFKLGDWESREKWIRQHININKLNK